MRWKGMHMSKLRLRCDEHQSDLMPRHVVCLALAAVIVALLLGFYLGGFDLESWARERSKPNPHYIDQERAQIFKDTGLPPERPRR